MNIASTVEEFFAGLTNEQREIVVSLRDVIRRVAPETSETIFYRSLSFHRPNVGGRIKGAVCLITPVGNDVRLEFIHGVRLADPARLLRGTRKSKRFVVIRSIVDARRRAIADLIRSAAHITFE